jgi:hypothetical protein
LAACPESVGVGCLAAATCAVLSADSATSNATEAITGKAHTPAVAQGFSMLTGVSPQAAENGQNMVAAVAGIWSAGSLMQQIRGPSAAAPLAATAPPLAAVLEGRAAGQGFSGVFDVATGRVLIRPSTPVSPVPAGWVARAGGHAEVSAALGGRAANHSGFAVVLQGNGSLNITWLSRTLNRTSNSLVPPQIRPQIVKSVEAATGRTVNF